MFLFFWLKTHGSAGEEKCYRKSSAKRTERELCRALLALSFGVYSPMYKYFLKCIYQNKKAEYLKVFGTFKPKMVTNKNKKRRGK